MPGLQIRLRPETLDEIVGNHTTIEIVRRMFERDKEYQHQTYLITGIPGTGKTTLARIMAELVGSSNTMEINGSSKEHRGIDAVETYKIHTKFPDLDGGRTVFIIDEAHGLTPAAKSALLKITEDVPPYVVWIFATPEPTKIPRELYSRCTVLHMEPVTKDEMINCFKDILDSQDFDFYSPVMDLLYKTSCGVLRDALKILDTVWDLDNTDQIVNSLKSYIPANETYELSELSALLLNKQMKPKDRWDQARDILSVNDDDPERIRQYLMRTFENIIARYDAPRVIAMSEFFLNNFFYSGKLGLYLAVHKACMEK